MNARLQKLALAVRGGASHLRAASSALVLAGLSGIAAAQNDPFTDAMTDATTKVTEYAGALVGLAAVAVVFMIAVKYVKKIVGAS